MFTDWDYNTEYDEDSVQIELNGDSAEASSDSVEINGSTVTITEEATYVISGTLNDGMIVVNASDTAKVHLVLAGADINSETINKALHPKSGKMNNFSTRYIDNLNAMRVLPEL